jgi:hypothetical protein
LEFEAGRELLKERTLAIQAAHSAVFRDLDD